MISNQGRHSALVAFLLLVSCAGAAWAGVTSCFPGSKFDDLNGDGVFQPGEPGVAGVQFEADTNGDGITDSFQVSDAAGAFQFCGTPSSQIWRFLEVVPAGTVATTPNPVFFEANPTVPHDTNFGNFALIAISGTAFDDLDADGARDPGEPGIPGILIELDLGADGTVDDATSSDAAGAFSFGNLGPGTYRIRQVLPGERVATTAPPADIVASSGTDATGNLFGSGPAPVPALDRRGLALLATLLALLGFKLAQGRLRS